MPWIKWVCFIMANVFGFSGNIGQKLKINSHPYSINPCQGWEAGSKSVFVAWGKRYHIGFGPAADIAFYINAPGLHLGFFKAQLRKGNPNLHTPTQGIDAWNAFPHRIPRQIGLFTVVLQQAIGQRTGRIYIKQVSIALVAIRI